MKTKLIYAFHIILIVVVAWGLGYSQAKGQEGTPPTPQAPQGPETAFAYQGSLKQAGSTVNGDCDFQFGLWDASSLGAQLGVTQTLTSTVSDGLFSVQLNDRGEFGEQAFEGKPRWLALTVRCPAGIGVYTSLGLQELNAVPYAIFSFEAGTSVGFSGSLSGDVTGGQSSTTVTKLQGRGVSSSVPVSGQMLKYDGTKWVPGGYQGLVTVAKSGGNFTSIQAALESITTASDTNRYLVKIMPGVYTEMVTMKPYVDIEGSGELATKITYTGNASSSTGTVLGVNNAELRFLTVANTGGTAYAIAIYNSSASPRLTHITANASGAVGNFGVYNDSSSPALTNVTASALGSADSSNFAVYNHSSSPALTNVTASASGSTLSYNVGVDEDTSNSIMNNVIASASGGNYSAGVELDESSSGMNNVTAKASGATFNYAVSSSFSSPVMTDVTASASGGYTNVGVKNSDSSPVMNNVTASASGGTTNIGVDNSTSSPVMTNVTASGSGGTTLNIGVEIGSSSSSTMTNVIATALGGTSSVAVKNDSSSSMIQNSKLRAIGGTNNYGIINSASSGTYTVKINSSQVTGSTNTIYNDSHFTTLVGVTLLDGGMVAANGGIFTCVGVYSGSYTALDNTCK